MRRKTDTVRNLENKKNKDFFSVNTKLDYQQTRTKWTHCSSHLSITPRE